MSIELGDEVRDKVSGFAGIVIGKTVFLHGCIRVGVQPKVGKDMKLAEATWFDEPQLDVTKRQKVRIGSRDTGGPMVSMPTRNMPK